MRTAVAHANATMPTACLAAKDATTTAAAGTVCSSHRAAARRSNPGDPDTGPGAARGSSSGFVASRVRIPSAVVWVSTGAELAVDGEETLEVGEVAPANRAVGGSNPVGRVVRGSRAVEDALGGDAEDAASVARRARGEKAREGRGRGVGSGRTGALGEASAPRGRERRDHGVGVAAARPVLVEQGSERGTEEGVRADHPGTGPEVRVRDERRGFRSGSGRPDARTVGNLRAALDVIHGRQPPAGGHPAVAHLRSRPRARAGV